MSNPNQAGKGDSPRPVDGDAFRDNYDEIFHKHKTQSTNKSDPSESQKKDNNSPQYKDGQYRKLH
jgi:hypothetical protein